MLRRIRQFFVALAAGRGPGPDDVDWVERVLRGGEAALFYQMAPRDQKHAVAVARRVEHLARERGIWDGTRIRILVRAALLHDVGKVRGDLDLWDRVFVVLFGRTRPSTTWIRQGREDLLQGRLPPVKAPGGRSSRRRRRPTWRSNLRRAFYAQAVHPSRGAAMAALVGAEHEVVRLIRRHQDAGIKETDGDDPDDEMLAILVQADRSA